MFFLNLSISEFLGLLTALAGLVTALYLLDRAKRKKVVSTLRFWTPALTSQERQTRRRMRDPWSLVLQLLSLLLLLLAIAQLEWGSRERRGRDHVLLLDTSAWTGEGQGTSTLLDREKAAAEQFLGRLPPRDRVMLVRVDALTIPITAFSTDRARVISAIRESSPGFTALNIDQALSFAKQAQTWSGGLAGETVYIGPGLIANNLGSRSMPLDLRILPVDASLANCGIRQITVKRSDDEANSWLATIRIKNYNKERALARLSVRFAGTVFAPRSVPLGPGEERSTDYGFVTNTAGKLLAHVEVGHHADALSSDDTAVLELPKPGLLRLAVFTARPEVLRPLLEPNHRLSVRFYSPVMYGRSLAADVLLLDGISSQQRAHVPSLWIVTDRIHSPVPVIETTRNTTITEWHGQTSLSTGLHAKERVSEAQVFQTFQGDLPVAGTSGGPVVIARPATTNQPKLAAIGFDPLADEMKFSVTTPLLVANLLQWLAPDSFQTVEVAAGRVGSSSIALEQHERDEKIEVRDERGFAVPVSTRQRTLQLFVDRPSILHINSEDRQRVLSLTLPDVADERWTPPQSAKSGVPAGATFGSSAVDLWQWLAILAAGTLFAEWFLFGSRRFTGRNPGSAPAGLGAVIRDPKRELVAE